MSRLRVLVIDDERPIRRLLMSALAVHDYDVHEASDGLSGIAAAANLRPDLALVDLGLPDLDGVEVIRRLREWATFPIIVLSVRDRESAKVAALDAGADDFVTKPFGMSELLARMRAALRRVLQEAPSPLFRAGGLEVDLARRRVAVEGREVPLTPTEYELLRFLVMHAGRVVTHRQALKQVWGEAFAGQAHLLRVNVSNLRRKLEPEPARPRYLLTEPGVGYRLLGDD
ncbi:MAG: response regulator [Candidatus Krumholzibacteriia bacterium]